MSERSKAVKEADKWFSKYIRARDPYCYCGKKTEQAGHLITRSSYSTRWDEQNTNGCCSGCNMKHEYHPEDYTMWFIKKYGTQQYEVLVARGHSVYKIMTSELRLLAKHYKTKWEGIKDGDRNGGLVGDTGKF